MPISTIQTKIKKTLEYINFSIIEDIHFHQSKNLKKSILEDTNIEIEIINEKKFYIYIKQSDFHEILANNFYYNYQRFDIQRNELQKLKDSSSVSWFLITMYYGAFFASNEISNLAGYYNFNFSSEEKKLLISKNISTNQKYALEFSNSDIKSYFGRLVLQEDEGIIKICCQNGGKKVHELAWNTLSKLLDGTSNADKQARTLRLSRILKADKKFYWKRPNQIRNEWNYSKAELYSSHNEQYTHDKNKYFNNFSELKRWAETRYKSPKNENDDFISIMFLFNTLSLVMDNIKNDILDFN